MQENFERYGDIYRATIHGSHVYVINSPDYAEHVLLHNWENFPRAGPVTKRIALSLGNGLMSSNGALWVSHRRMIQPAFTHAAVAAQFGTIVRSNVALREKWRHAAEQGIGVDVTQDVSSTVLEVMLYVTFGEDYAQVARHFEIVGEESRNLQFASNCSALKKVIIRLASQRRAGGREDGDLLGLMLRARDRDSGRPMSDTQLANEALTLVVAGHETTASVLNWVWYLLARNPEVESRLVRELRDLLGAAEVRFDDLARFTYTRQVIEETLRTYPPGWLMERRAIDSDRLGDYLLPAGAVVYISPYLLQRHPRLWRDPDRFDPGRFADKSTQRPRLSMCPFSAGPRNCVGEFFARVEMQVHVMLIARALRLRYEQPKPAELVAGVNLLSRGHFIMQPQLRV
jgi:cytochrome P450